MSTRRTLGLDSSNYTTSAAVFDGSSVSQAARLLDVAAGALGLRQSEALFQHVRQMPALLEELRDRGVLSSLSAVGASTRPRAVEGSYMPCFLAGQSQGRGMAAALGVPFYAFSHQQGHLAAAAWSAGRPELLDEPFLAWHLSGGTTELLLAHPDGSAPQVRILGGTTDISAGQLIDRAGVLLGLAFPAGRALDELYGQGTPGEHSRVKLRGLSFSLSGMENKVKEMAEQAAPPAAVARFVLDTAVDIVVRTTQEAMARYPGLPVLCSGGVASNTRLRAALGEACGALFAAPEFSRDNAAGIAVLTLRALERGEKPYEP